MERIEEGARFLCEIVSQASQDIKREIVEFKCLELSIQHIKVQDLNKKSIYWFEKELFNNKSNYGIHGYFITEILAENNINVYNLDVQKLRDTASDAEFRRKIREMLNNLKPILDLKKLE